MRWAECLITPTKRGQHGLSSMVQEIEVEVKKVWYVGFESDNNTICCKYKQFGRGVKMMKILNYRVGRQVI